MTTMGRELRLAVRSLLRAPEYTGVAILTLALGIGGSTAIYTLLDRVVLDPLPYPRSERLVRLDNAVPCVGTDTRWSMATAQYVHYGDRARSLASIGAYRRGGANVTTPDGAERIRVVRASASMMDLLGAEAELGRLIAQDDDRPNAEDVAVVSHEFWTRSYGGSPDVIGRSLTLDDRPYTVIGVAAPGLDLPDSPFGLSPDVWTALRIDPAGPHHNNHVIPMIARLSPGVDAAAAEAELDGLRHEFPAAFPGTYSRSFIEDCGFRTLVTPLKADVVGGMARNLWILFGAVGFVLLIACANAANLFLVRLDGRRRDLAVRRALGAGRLALAGHLLAESLALGLTAGLLACLVAFWALPALLAAAPESLPRMGDVRLGVGGVLFALGLSATVALVLALVPIVLGRTGTDPSALRDGGRGPGGDRDRHRLRAGLVVAQVALALTLAVGAGLMLETVRHLAGVEPGFDPDGVFAAQIELSPARYPHDVEAWEFYKEFLERVRRIPGVEAAGMSQELPLSGGYGCTVQGFADQAVLDRLQRNGVTLCAGEEQTSPGFFEAMGIPLLRGRTFEDRDNDDPSRGVVVVSQAFAERFWGEENPIGRMVGPSGTSDPRYLYRVVGVVGDVAVESLDGPPAIAIYYPLRWIPPTRISWPGSMTVVIRTDRQDPLATLPAVHQALAEIDPTIPLSRPREMEAVIDASMARISFTSILLQISALVALALAAVGLYGVISYVVGQRTREIGMRMALGAAPGQVERQIVSGSLLLTGMGVGIGLGLAGATTRLLEGLLVGVEPTSPLAFGAAAAVLGGVTVVASWIPARRASHIDPSEALRAD